MSWNPVPPPTALAGTCSFTGKLASAFAFTITEAGVVTTVPAGPLLFVVVMLNCTAFGAALWTVTVFVALKSQDGKSLTAQQVFVTVSGTRGDQAAVSSGIKDGDQVVTTGQLKLKNGTALEIDNSVEPKDDPHPTPQEQ